MTWYLYIVGFFAALAMFMALNADKPEDNKVSGVVYVIVSALWPVTFPALLVGGILMTIAEVIGEDE